MVCEHSLEDSFPSRLYAKITGNQKFLLFPGSLALYKVLGKVWTHFYKGEIPLQIFFGYQRPNYKTLKEVLLCFWLI